MSSITNLLRLGSEAKKPPKPQRTTPFKPTAGTMKEFRIPAYLLTNSTPDRCSTLDEPGDAPMIAFLNPKSGDASAVRLYDLLKTQLGSGQVELGGLN
eukprot:1177390-Prorocentrum_minimum.AAC.8